jgi:hypothetical protein
MDGRNVIETNELIKYTDFGRGLKLHSAFTAALGKE